MIAVPQRFARRLIYHHRPKRNQGERGGSHPEAAYRRFVAEGLAAKPEDPFREAVGGWLLGSPKFVDRVRAGMTSPRHPDGGNPVSVHHH